MHVLQGLVATCQPSTGWQVAGKVVVPHRPGPHVHTPEAEQTAPGGDAAGPHATQVDVRDHPVRVLQVPVIGALLADTKPELQVQVPVMPPPAVQLADARTGLPQGVQVSGVLSFQPTPVEHDAAAVPP